MAVKYECDRCTKQSSSESSLKNVKIIFDGDKVAEKGLCTNCRTIVLKALKDSMQPVTTEDKNADSNLQDQGRSQG